MVYQRNLVLTVLRVPTVRCSTRVTPYPSPPPALLMLRVKRRELFLPQLPFGVDGEQTVHARSTIASRSSLQLSPEPLEPSLSVFNTLPLFLFSSFFFSDRF